MSGQQVSATEKTLRTIFAIIVVTFIILGIIAGIYFFTKVKPVEDKATTFSQNEIKYAPGEYIVQINDKSVLNLRDNHSKDGNIIKTVPNNTVLTLTEFFFDESAQPAMQYWGKTHYMGYDLWVSLSYLKKSDGSLPVSGQSTTVPVNVQTEPEKTTQPIEKTTAEEKTSLEEKTTQSTSSHGSPTVPGKYKVIADDVLHLRDGHNLEAESILDIPNGWFVTVTEVYHDESAVGEPWEYWGKVTRDGVVGWVAMKYLESAPQD